MQQQLRAKIGEMLLLASSLVKKDTQQKVQRSVKRYYHHRHCDHPLILELNESIEHRIALNERSFLISLFFVLDERMMNDVYWIRPLLQSR